MVKVKIVGDHSKTHCGCKAVIHSLYNLLDGYKIVDKDSDLYDVLIVNGEGSMHHGSANFKSKMNALSTAVKGGKDAVLINSVWQKNPNDYDDVLRRLKSIIVREPASQQDLYENHGIESLVRCDISLQAPINKLDDYIDFHGKEVLTDFFSPEFRGWVKYSGGARYKYPYLDMRKFSWSEFVMSLQTAGLLITGRHHAVFGACKARIPFVAVESNTHKISSFVNAAKMKIPVCTNPRELTGAIKWAKENTNAYLEFFQYLDEQPRLTLKDMGL